MRVVLLRIGIDTGSGGIHGPLFADGTFEYIPIPDGQAVDERTYGNLVGRHGRKLIDYFPESMRNRMADQSIHVDPEFEIFHLRRSHLAKGWAAAPKARRFARLLLRVAGMGLCFRSAHST